MRGQIPFGMVQDELKLHGYSKCNYCLNRKNCPDFYNCPYELCGGFLPDFSRLDGNGLPKPEYLWEDSYAENEYTPSNVYIPSGGHMPFGEGALIVLAIVVGAILDFLLWYYLFVPFVQYGGLFGLLLFLLLVVACFVGPYHLLEWWLIDKLIDIKNRKNRRK